MFAHFNTWHFLDNQGDDDEEHSKSPLFLHLMCSLRNPSSQGQPTSTVSINTLPVCLGEYSVTRQGQASWYCDLSIHPLYLSTIMVKANAYGIVHLSLKYNYTKIK